MHKPPVLVAPLYAQSIDNFHTAPLLSVVRLYELDETATRIVGHVPNRVITGGRGDWQSRSGVVFRSRDTLYAHFRRDQVAEVIAAVTERLRAAGYERITFAGTAQNTRHTLPLAG